MARLNQIVKHLDKAIKFIKEDSEKNLRSKTRSSYEKIIVRAKEIIALCEPIIVNSIIEEQKNEIQELKELILQQQKSIDNLNLRLNNKNIVEDQKSDNNTSSTSDDKSSKTEKLDQKTYIKGQSNKPKVKKDPKVLNKVIVEPMKVGDYREFSINFCNVLDGIVNYKETDKKFSGETKTFSKLSHDWFNTRFVISPNPKTHKYRLEYVPGWLALLVIRYSSESLYGSTRKLSKSMDNWIERVHNNPEDPYGTPSFMVKKTMSKYLKEFNPDQIEIIKRKSRDLWSRFYICFNTVSNEMGVDCSFDLMCIESQFENLGI